MNCIIIHGSNPRDREKLKAGFLPQNKRNWISWLKDKLEERGIKVFTPLMPENWRAVYENWKKEFDKLPVDEESILIGHSAGAVFLLRVLGETKQRVKKLILIAPVLGSEENEFYKKFCDFEIDNSIKERIDKIVIFVSDNDKPGRTESGKLIYEKLGGRLIELKERGHFTESGMGTKEFPELLEEVLDNR